MDEQSKLLFFFFLQRRHLQHTQWPLTPHGLFITTLRPCHCFYFVHNYYSEHPVVWGVEVSSGQGPHKVRTFLQVSARPLVDHIIFETGEFGPLQHIQLKMSANAITCDFFSFFFFSPILRISKQQMKQWATIAQSLSASPPWCAATLSTLPEFTQGNRRGASFHSCFSQVKLAPQTSQADFCSLATSTTLKQKQGSGVGGVFHSNVLIGKIQKNVQLSLLWRTLFPHQIEIQSKRMYLCEHTIH